MYINHHKSNRQLMFNDHDCFMNKHINGVIMVLIDF